MREREANAVEKAVIAELHRRNVHSHMPRNWPGRRLAAGLAEQPSAKGNDQAGFPATGMNTTGDTAPWAGRVQRIRASAPTISPEADIYLGLIVDGKPAPL